MKKIIYIFLISCNLLLFVGCQNDDNNANSSNIQVNRTSTSISNTTENDNKNPVENTNSNQNVTENSSENIDANQNETQNPSESIDANQNETQDPSESTDANQNETQNPTENQSDNQNAGETPSQTSETVAAEFTTQIKTKSKNRANNIQITCSKINEKVIKSNEEFSFCKTIGVSTESEGYKKADVIVGKKVIQALGGGNCQVSSTLYNAALAVPEIEVTERHPHGKKVNYVPEGKDAAIAHGLKDLKFKNNSNKDLKIYASSDGTTVYVKLVYMG